MPSSYPACLGSLLAATVLAGCATAPPGQRFEAHGRLALASALGPIGISFSHPVPDFHSDLPVNRRKASGEFAAEMTSNPDPQGAIALPGIYLVSRVIGSGLGVSESTLSPAREQVGAAVAVFPARQLLDEAVRRALDPRGGLALASLEDGFPVEPRQMHGRITTDGTTRLTWTAGAIEPHPLQGSSIATLVGLRVVHQGLRAKPNLRPRGNVQEIYNEFNPPLVLELAVELAALRVDDWTSYGSISFRCESGPYRFTDWAADDARLLRQELAAAWAAVEGELSSRIVLGPPNLLAEAR